MTLTKIVVVLGAALLLPLGWELFNSESVKKLFSAPSNRPATIQFDNGSATPRSSVAGDANKPATRINRCMNGPSVIYTDEPCPTGSNGQVMGDGSKTVGLGITGAVPSRQP
jgi:hypothetical protein